MEESCQSPVHGGGYSSRENCECTRRLIFEPLRFCNFAVQSYQEGFQTLNLLNLLPTVHCASPKDVALARQQLGKRQLE